MNNWRYRLVAGALLWVIADIHRQVASGLPNTEEWMLVYHGSAAVCEWMIFMSLPWLLKGKLCTDMQALSQLCIWFNALGWVLYMAYAPPYINNFLLGGMAYVQYGRLFMGDRNVADLIRAGIFWRTDTRRARANP